MIALSREARRDVAALARYCIRKDRAVAVGNLLAAIDHAAAQISANPHGGLHAPRPYPAVARPGRAWTKGPGAIGSYTLWATRRSSLPCAMTRRTFQTEFSSRYQVSFGDDRQLRKATAVAEQHEVIERALHEGRAAHG